MSPLYLSYSSSLGSYNSSLLKRVQQFEGVTHGSLEESVWSGTILLIFKMADVISGEIFHEDDPARESQSYTAHLGEAGQSLVRDGSGLWVCESTV